MKKRVMFFRKKTTSHQHTVSIIILVAMIAVTIGVKLWRTYHIPTLDVRLAGQSLHLLLADTPSRQHLGLGQRDSIFGYDGMIFVFPEARQYGFVMRDMHFPLDIVWLHDGIVVDIAPNVPLEPGATEANLHVYYPRDVANTVIEFPAGWVKNYNLKIGDQLVVL